MRNLYDSLALIEEMPEMEQVLIKAKQVLHQSKRFNKDEKQKLNHFFEEIVKWNDYNDFFEDYFQQFDKVIRSMYFLEHTEKLPIDDERKTLLNFISVGINSLNEEAENNVVAKATLDHFKDLVPFSSFITDHHYIMKGNNKKLEERLGYDEKELAHQPIEFILSDFNQLKPILDEQRKIGGIITKVKTKTGEELVCKLAVKSAIIGNGNIVGYSFFIYEYEDDITHYHYQCPIPYCSFNTKNIEKS